MGRLPLCQIKSYASHLKAYVVLSSRVKRPSRESDHSPPSNIEVMHECSCTSAPLYAFAVWTGTTASIIENIIDVYYESQLFNAV
jgi:hypothetical protein